MMRNAIQIVCVAAVALLCSYVQAGTESPILHWTFDDPADITRDVSGNGHDLIIPSTWSSVPGVAGNAIHFDEYSSDSTNWGPTPEGPYTPTSGMNYPTAQGFAVSYWSKLDTESSVIDYWQHRAAGETFTLAHQMSTGLALFTLRHDFTNPPVLTGTANSSYIGGWMHLVGVYDPSNGPKAKLYVNGELAGERNMPAPMRTSIPPNVFTSGSWHGTNESTVDDVRIYNRALSSTDVLSLYNGPIPVPLRSVSAVDIAAGFVPGGGAHGLGELTAVGEADVVVEDIDDLQTTYAGGSFEMTASLLADNSAGGLAAGVFSGGDLAFRDSGGGDLLTGDLIELLLYEVGDDMGMLAGSGLFAVTGGSLEARFAETHGEIFQMFFHVTPRNMDNFSAAFTGFTDITITPVPEPATLGMLTLGGLAVLRRRRRKQASAASSLTRIFHHVFCELP